MRSCLISFNSYVHKWNIIFFPSLISRCKISQSILTWIVRVHGRIHWDNQLSHLKFFLVTSFFPSILFTICNSLGEMFFWHKSLFRFYCVQFGPFNIPFSREILLGFFILSLFFYIFGYSILIAWWVIDRDSNEGIRLMSFHCTRTIEENNLDLRYESFFNWQNIFWCWVVLKQKMFTRWRQLIISEIKGG